MASGYLILWILIVVLIAGIHLYISNVKQVSPNKPLWLVIRIVIACVIGYLDLKTGIRPLILLIVAYTFSGWFLHDVICAVGMGRAPWYLNGTGVLDRLQSSIGHPAAFVLKAIGFFGSVGMYFWNY